MNEQDTDGPYDLEAVYDEQIAPLMAQIIAICREHRMPMIASFAYAANDEDVTSFCSTAIRQDTVGARWPDKYKEVASVLLRGAVYDK